MRQIVRAGDASAHPLVRRHPLVTAAVVVSLVALGGWTIAASEPEPDPIVRLAECLPYEEPTSVDDLNDVVATYRAQPAFQGGDVGASATLSDGRRLWVFGDTLRSPGYGTQRMVRNSMLVFGDGCATVVESRDNGPVVPDRADGVGYWPMSIAAVPRDGHDVVGVMMQRVRTVGDGAMGFENLGPAVAEFRVEPGGVPVLQRVRDLGPDDPDKAKPSWGAAMVVDGEDLLLYGTATIDDPYVFGWSLHVARTTIGKVHEPDTWDIVEQPLIPAADGVSQTLSVFEQDGTWYALSKKADFVGDELVVWTAPSPTGPFTERPALAQIPSTTDHWLYMPLAHPQMLPEDGSMIVSVSQNSPDLDAVIDNPLLYRPRFLRVDLPPASGD